MEKFDCTYKYKLIYVFSMPYDTHKGLLKIGEATLTTDTKPEFLTPNCRELNQAAIARIKGYTATASVNFKLEHTELAVLQKDGYAMKSEETKPWLPALETWVNVTTPSDSIGQVGWLFHDFYYCHSPEISECDDWEGNPKPIESKRVEVINALAQEHSEKLNALVRYSNDDASWGSFYARVLSSAMLLNFVYEARRLQKMGFFMDC